MGLVPISPNTNPIAFKIPPQKESPLYYYPFHAVTACRAGGKKTPSAIANDVNRPMPFQMPARLADGLEVESPLSV